ncbi:hypothetical protein HYFRA_00008936 [Hymenoscyphus fraxineus]|uniref:Uncharacterized protein n=1 Tax=Hymenoscyphus fraxineus TaxID=746836 RepID=A0A9N9KRQ9_9HELO|nr:hypothetical protein HYFRA_00008936 [Hymenoscyphus fraxineus]
MTKLPNRWRRPVATVATQTPKNSQYCTPTQFSDEVKDRLMVLLGEGCLPTDTPSPEDEYKDLRALHQTYVEHCAKNQILGYTRFADGKKESRDLARSPPTFEDFQTLLYHFMYEELKTNEIDLRRGEYGEAKVPVYGLDHMNNGDYDQIEYLDRNQLWWIIVAANDNWGTFFDVFYIVEGHYGLWDEESSEWVENWMRPAMAGGWVGPGCRPAIFMYTGAERLTHKEWGCEGDKDPEARTIGDPKSCTWEGILPLDNRQSANSNFRYIHPLWHTKANIRAWDLRGEIDEHMGYADHYGDPPDNGANDDSDQRRLNRHDYSNFPILPDTGDLDLTNEHGGPAEIKRVVNDVQINGVQYYAGAVLKPYDGFRNIHNDSLEDSTYTMVAARKPSKPLIIAEHPMDNMTLARMNGNTPDDGSRFKKIEADNEGVDVPELGIQVINYDMSDLYPGGQGILLDIMGMPPVPRRRKRVTALDGEVVFEGLEATIDDILPINDKKPYMSPDARHNQRTDRIYREQTMVQRVSDRAATKMAWARGAWALLNASALWYQGQLATANTQGGVNSPESRRISHIITVIDVDRTELSRIDTRVSNQLNAFLARQIAVIPNALLPPPSGPQDSDDEYESSEDDDAIKPENNWEKWERLSFEFIRDWKHYRTPDGKYRREKAEERLEEEMEGNKRRHCKHIRDLKIYTPVNWVSKTGTVRDTREERPANPDIGHYEYGSQNLPITREEFIDREEDLPDFGTNKIVTLYRVRTDIATRRLRRQETPWGLPPLLAVWKTQIWNIDANTRSSRLRRYCGWIGADASRSDAAMLQDIVEWRENNLSQLDIRVFKEKVSIPLRAVDDPERNQDPNSVNTPPTEWLQPRIVEGQIILEPTDRRRLIFEQDEEVVMYGPPMVRRVIGQDSEVYRIVIDLEGNAAAVPLSVIDRLSDLDNINDDKGITPFDMILGRPPQRVQRYEDSESSEDDDGDSDSLPPSSDSEEISDGERTPEPCAPPHARNPHATWSGLQGSDEEEEEEEDDDDDDDDDPDRSQSEGSSSGQQVLDPFDETSSFIYADSLTPLAPDQDGDDDAQSSRIPYSVSEAS